jgi:high-affinity nickel-transport protein
VTLLVTGGALVLFRIAIPPRLGLGLEFAVALMLILLGFSNLRVPAGVQPAAAAGSDRAVTQLSEPAPRGRLKPLFIGIVHGLAGSAAVALLVLAAIPNPFWAIGYLAVFGAGTIAGMTVVTWIIAAPAIYATRRVERLQHTIRLAAGALSLIFGIVLAREIVVDGGLFADSPTWTPH